MKDVMGIINLNEDRSGLKEIAEGRTIAAIPVGSKYRIIDFVLSNMVNSGIKNIGLIRNTFCRSLMDHFRSKKEWGFEKRGLHILTSIQEKSLNKKNTNHLEGYYSNLDYFVKSKEKYVLISGSDIICHIDYNKIKDFHIKNKADITVVYKKEKYKDLCSKFRKIALDKNNRVTSIQTGNKGTDNNLLLEMFFLEKSLLIQFMEKYKKNKACDFLREGVLDNIDKLKVLGYAFEGYMTRVNCIDSYYNFNVDLLDEEIMKELLCKGVFTKLKDETPAIYKEGAEVSNSLIANGCIIEGRVENSVLFRDVKVEKGAFIKNSIIMQSSSIKEGAVVENAILDKEVIVQKDKYLIGNLKSKKVIPKKTIV